MARSSNRGFTLVELPAVSGVRRAAFTLVELLVVIGIIALMIAILMPALSTARAQAKSVTSLSNLRQVGIGLVQYRVENKGYYPVASWNKLNDRARFRWADAIYPYMKNTEVYMSPQLDEAERVRMNKPFFHATTMTASDGSEIIPGKTVYWGGYGYNWQYLGNGRTTTGAPEFFAKEGVQIRATSKTVAVADTNGSKNGTSSWTSEGVYVIDPPLMSQTMGSRGSRKASTPAPNQLPATGNYGYTGGADGDALHRSTPAERNRGHVNVLFCDGHGEPLKLKDLDDSNGDGQVDNAYWNGKFDANRR
jgi:prepilin-type processing-associated H-X9-DG protein